MSTFPEALETALERHYGVQDKYKRAADTTAGFRDRRNALERHYGSKAAAARAAGISPDTWSRWTTKKRTPDRLSVEKIQRAHLALLRAKKTRGRSAATTPRRMNITADVACLPTGGDRKRAYYNRTPYRTFRADRPSLNLGDMVTAWAAGKAPAEVARLAERAVEDAFGFPFAFEGTQVEVEFP